MNIRFGGIFVTGISKGTVAYGSKYSKKEVKQIIAVYEKIQLNDL